MTLQLMAPTLTGTGASYKLGSGVRFSCPAGSQVRLHEDPKTGWLCALVRVPRPGYVHPWRLHVITDHGELVGLSARVILATELEFFR